MQFRSIHDSDQISLPLHHEDINQIIVSPKPKDRHINIYIILLIALKSDDFRLKVILSAFLSFT